VFSFIKEAFPPVIGALFLGLASRFFFIAVAANFPLVTVPTMFYAYVTFVAFLFWVPIIFHVLAVTPKRFFSHLLPSGTPTKLMFFLPIIEIASQLIRPLTLLVRFATNLSAGHILIFMFSYFILLSRLLSPFIYAIILFIMVLETFIVFMQVYIFITLLGLYTLETL
jgi:F-type H+-transporting ATPase subunit a